MKAYVKELTQYPESRTNDLVMATWFPEWNLPQILRAATRDSEPMGIEGIQLPPYLARQRTSATCEAMNCGRAIADHEQGLCAIHLQQVAAQWGGRHITPRPTPGLEEAIS